MSNITQINDHPNFRSKAARTFDRFVSACDNAMLPKRAGPVNLPMPSPLSFKPELKEFVYRPDKSRTPHVPE